jgi:hypothetical protein
MAKTDGDSIDHEDEDGYSKDNRYDKDNGDGKDDEDEDGYSKDHEDDMGIAKTMRTGQGWQQPGQ